MLCETIYLLIESIDYSICPSTFSHVAYFNYSSYNRTSKNLTKWLINSGLYYNVTLPTFKITLLSTLGFYKGKAKTKKFK